MFQNRKKNTRVKLEWDCNLRTNVFIIFLLYGILAEKNINPFFSPIYPRDFLCAVHVQWPFTVATPVQSCSPISVLICHTCEFLCRGAVRED